MTRLKTTHEGFPNTPEGWDMIINDDFEQLLKAYGEAQRELAALRETNSHMLGIILGLFNAAKPMLPSELKAMHDAGDLIASIMQEPPDV